MDFIAAYLPSVGIFLNSGWGTTTTVCGGALIIGIAIVHGLRKSAAVGSQIETWNYTIVNATNYILVESAYGKSLAGLDYSKSYNAATLALTDAAAKGRLAIAGRHFKTSALETIPAKFWTTAKISLAFDLERSDDPYNSHASHKDHESYRTSEYDGLMVNKTEVQKLWPKYH